MSETYKSLCVTHTVHIENVRKRAHRLALLSLLYSLLPSVSVHRSSQTVDTTACHS